MPLCEACARLSVEELDDNDVEFHPDLQHLASSAEAGCDLCLLFWTRLRNRHGRMPHFDQILNDQWPDPPDGHEWTKSIWLRGQFPRNGPGESCIWISCGPSSSFDDGFNPELNMTSDVNVFAQPGSPCETRFRGRWSTLDHNSDLHLPLAHSWLDQCRRFHKLCQWPENPEMPTRVIDVGSPQDGVEPRLVPTDGMKEPYVALSYCWGRSAYETTKLTDDNYYDLLDAIHEDTLSKSLREAIKATRGLGFRYLWIDALCIKQGNIEDWQYESTRMGLVYQNASLTIIAGRSGDCGLGFVQNDARHPVPHCAIPYRIADDGKADINMGEVFATLPRSHAVGPVRSRGWCFQEDLLSHRCLVYGEQQVFFRCEERTIYEDSFVVSSNTNRIPQTLDLIRARVTDEASQAEVRAEALYIWYQSLLYDFTERHLTEPHDIFAAISSLAQIVQPCVGGRYLAGLWDVDLVRGLLWRSRHQLRGGPANRDLFRPFSRPLERKPELRGKLAIRAPSWSWASLQGPVFHRIVQAASWSRQYTDVLIRPRYESPSRWTLDTECGASTLFMPECELHLYGRPRRVRISDEPTSNHPGKKTKIVPGRSLRNIPDAVFLEPGDDQGDGEESQGNVSASRFVGMGFFDTPIDEVPECWGLPLVKQTTVQEGLLLGRNPAGKFYRLGLIQVDDDAWFSSAEEQSVDLI